jgi:hypothetical protein
LTQKFDLSGTPEQPLRTYVNNHLKEEIAAESLVRNLLAFSSFLEIAALSDAELATSSDRRPEADSHILKLAPIRLQVHSIRN